MPRVDNPGFRFAGYNYGLSGLLALLDAISEQYGIQTGKAYREVSEVQRRLREQFERERAQRGPRKHKKKK